MIHLDCRVCFIDAPAETRFGIIVLPPGPAIAKPNGGKKVQLRRFGSAIDGTDANENVFHFSLSILNKHVEVAVLIKDASVHQLKLWSAFAAPSVFFDQLGVRKFRLRVLV